MERIACVECSLQIVNFATFREALDRGDLTPVGLDGKGQAAVHDMAIQHDETGTARAHLAADVTPGEMKLVSQHVDQRRPGLNRELDQFAIHCD